MSPLARMRAVLGSLCGLLAIAIVYEVLAPIGDVPVAAGVIVRLPAERPLEPAFVMPASAGFAAIDARPVFDRSRLPVAGPPGPMPGAGTALGQMSLVGVIIDSDRRIALVRSANAPLALSYPVGAFLGGSRIVEIDPDKVVLRSADATTQELRMSGESKTPVSPAGDGL